MPLIYPYDGTNDTMILGGKFIESFVTKFDYSTNTVSLAHNAMAVDGVKAHHHMKAIHVVEIFSATALVAIIAGCCICKFKCKRGIEGNQGEGW